MYSTGDYGFYRNSYIGANNYTSRSSLPRDRYSSSSGYSSSRDTALDRYDHKKRSGLTNASILPSRNYDYSKYSDYSPSSRAGRSETKPSEIVRPSIRSRYMSTGREASTIKREYSREHSLPRPRGSATDYPELSPTYKSTYHQPSPVRSSVVPEFKEIKSNYNKPPRVVKNGAIATRSPSMTNGTTSLINGHASPPKIESERRIHRPSALISVDEQAYDSKPYSPAFVQNRTSNNNKEYDSNGSSSHSLSSSRRDEYLQNDEGISSSASSGEFKDPRAGLVGLKNIGNTCFMNSILQCLSNTRPLRNYCINERYKKDINKTSSPMKGRLVEAFSSIIHQLWHPSSIGSAVPTSPFKSQIQKFSNRFSGYEQQDSQEFLRFLIEGLHEDVNKVTSKPKGSVPNFDTLGDESKAKKTWDFYLSKDNSYIVDLFMGQLRSSLKCAECEHVSTTFDPFWDLSLPIPKNRYDEVDLQLCLSNFTKEETLDGDERPTCDRCKARRRMTKKFTIYRFPRILVIHLKRFSEGQRFRHKLSDNVRFPDRLEISKPIATSPVSYNLYAVSNHSGSCYGGHYTAYCKNPQDDKWHTFSDSLVSSMSQSSVQSKEAYVLFYEMSSSSRSRSNL